MDDRIKAGYTITDSIQIGETEFVLGRRGGSFPMYVTWACKGGENYYWGHYFGDLLEAQKDLLARAGEELEYQMIRQFRSADEPKEKESGKEHER